MSVRSIIKNSVAVGIVVLLFFLVSYIRKAIPIIGAYGAKNLCSCVMLGNRTPESVIENELGSFPLSLGEYQFHPEDSSATGSIFGSRERKAIYRKGLGCTLLSQIDEEGLRQQKPDVPTPPAIDQDTIDWPMGDRMEKFPPFQMDYVKLNEVVEGAFEYPDSRRTRAILVVYRGILISEKYAEGFDKDSRMMGWSMTKSLTNAIVGNLVQQKNLKVTGVLPIFEWRNDDRRKITLDNMLRMSSGLNWNEKYSGPSSATNMLFNAHHAGVFAADSKLEDEPGTTFYYSSGTTNIISRSVRIILGDVNYYQYPYEEIFYKIGMYSLVMEPDAGGTFVGSSFAYATARDWARFGLLYLQKGEWNGEQILPKDWVKYSTTPTEGAPRGEYGAHFWLNAGAPGNPKNRIYPDVPTDLYWADGFEGQNVFILPSKSLVVVKLSQTSGDALDDNEFLKSIIEILP